MTKPTYLVGIEAPEDFAFTFGDLWINVNSAVGSGLGWSHRGFYDEQSGPFRFDEVTFNCRIVGTPTDQLNVAIWDLTDDPLLHLPADALFVGSPKTISATANYTWDLGQTIGRPGRVYVVAAYRTGATDNSNYYELHYIGIPSDYDIAGKAAVWVHTEDYTLHMAITYADVDITEDVIDLTIIPGGKNETDGKFVEGSCDLTLKNKDYRYNVENLEAERYGWINLGSRMYVKAEWDSTWYGLFVGTVERIKPSMEFADRTFYIELVDEFHRFKEEEVDLGTLSGKTADEIITAVMAQLGFTNYSLDADPDVLRTVTWNAVNAMSSLETVVAAGQHSHFVDGDGNYVFKNNQWPAAGDSDFEFDLEDPCVFISKPSIEYDRGQVINSVNVQYGGSSYTGWKDDADSIAAYLKKTLRFDNELIPSLGYAIGIRDFLLEGKKDPGADVDFTLINKFPDMLQLSPGKRIQVNYAPLGINRVYVALDFEHNVALAGDHTLKLKSSKWVNPPSLSWYDYKPHGVKNYLNVNVYAKAQSFKVPTSGDLLEVEVLITGISGAGINQTHTLKIYAADGSEHPTGALLAESEGVFLINEAYYVFPFTGADRIAISNATVYCFKLDITTRIWRFKGGTSNPVASRQLSYYNGSWIDWTNHDAWFRVRLKT